MKNSLLSAEVTKGQGAGEADGGPFSGVLEPGERVLWAGQPQPFRMMRSKSVHALLGAIVLGMLTMTPVRGAVDSPAQVPDPPRSAARRAVELVVVGFACYGLLVPFVAYRRAKRTWYAVTDRRVIRVQQGWLEAGADLDQVDMVNRRGITNGTGDILLSPILTDGKNVSSRFLRGMFGIPGAHQAYRTIDEAREERARGREQVVHDYLEFLLQGKRPDSLVNH